MFELPHSTITDIAVLSRTSKENVARVMLGKSGVPVETQKRIVQAIKILSKPETPQDASNIFSVVMIDHLTEDDHLGYVAQGIAQSAEKNGLRMMLNVLANEHEYEASYFELLRRNGLTNGIIILMPYDYRQLFAFCRKHEIPTVFLDCYTDHVVTGSPLVESDNYGGARLAIEHLLQLGHRRIAHIAGPLHIRSAAERARAYQDTLAAANITYDRRLLLEGNFTKDVGRIQARALLNLPNPPTAIFAANDHMALGAMLAAHELGLTIGRDISIVGCDDLEASSQTCPGLTTIRQPMIEMGERTGDLMASLLRGEKQVELHHLFPTELVVRGSVGGQI